MEKYSKKVMDHFLKPHNLGELKKADGEGELGNLKCLIGETLLHTNAKLEKIKNIKKNNQIISHDGKYNIVTDIHSRNISEKIIILKNRLGEIKLTTDHLIYGVKIPNEKKYLRSKYKKKLIPAWYHAEDLRKGDFVLYSIYSEIKDSTELSVDTTKKKWDYNSNPIPQKIKIDGDFLRLVGYYLAEGYYQDKVTKTNVIFSFNINEINLAEDIVNISKKIFGITPIIRKNPKKNTLLVYINNVFVVRLFKKLFEVGAKNKDIPELFMALPPEKQKHLIFGLWMGDGYFNVKIPRGGYSTISEELIHKIKILLLRQGIIPSIYTEEEKIDKNKQKHQKCYRIHVGGKESTTKLAKILKINLKNNKPEAINSWITNSFLYTPITGKKTEYFSGKVYNLEVDKAHSYNTTAFTVHNCGDVMKIYIKVKKDPKTKKEIITDIKFKTLGCAAAIATSSMITDLAKGKTLEEALKITRADVAKELGGLPPVKMHCSNLSADALHLAIKNYLEKNKEGDLMKVDEHTKLGKIIKLKGVDKILEKYNVPCLSCPMAKLEIDSLEIGDVCDNYGIPKKELILEINKKLKERDKIIKAKNK